MTPCPLRPWACNLPKGPLFNQRAPGSYSSCYPKVSWALISSSIFTPCIDMDRIGCNIDATLVFRRMRNLGSRQMANLDEIASEMESLIESWRIKLLELNESAAHFEPAPDRWSISEVVGHLVDSACNNHQRFVRAQHCTEFVFPKYDQNEWVVAAAYRASEWKSLVELWYHYNRQLAVLIRNIRVASLSTPCTITPYESSTLGFLVEDYLAHLKHHVAILADRIANFHDS